ncbi:MAG: hypothetical protein MJ162_07400, partial [Treponema sp.]|nr:hypothetical protein [Treponema sp.]
MKCYILRWNLEKNHFTKEKYADFYKRWKETPEQVGLIWQIDQWEDAHKGDMFIILQDHSDNDGILVIGKFASEPYEKISPRTGNTGHMIDLEILTAFDRNPESKILVAFQLEKEFPEINWRDGICGELIDMFVADRLSIRIMEELMARDIW